MKSNRAHKYIGMLLLLVVILAAVCFFANPAIAYGDSVYTISNSNPNGVYDMGTNIYGMPVFKHPSKAFEQALQDYADGIEALHEAYDLSPISEDTWASYGAVGMEFPTDDEKIKAQAVHFAQFCDIYENSFQYGF